MPGLGRTQQVLIMMIIWAAVLIVIDKRLNIHPERAKPLGSATHPRIVFGLNHLCCSGCYDNIFKAIKQQSWLTNPTLPPEKKLQTHEQAFTVDPRASIDTYAGEVVADLDPTQTGLVDLMRIYRDIEAEGFALEHFTLTNVPHFRLSILLPHLCCPTCKTAVGKMCDLSPQNALHEELSKLNLVQQPVVEQDGVTVECKGDTDVALIIKALRKVGYVPRDMHLTILQ